MQLFIHLSVQWKNHQQKGFPSFPVPINGVCQSSTCLCHCHYCLIVTRLPCSMRPFSPLFPLFTPQSLFCRQWSLLSPVLTSLPCCQQSLLLNETILSPVHSEFKSRRTQRIHSLLECCKKTQPLTLQLWQPPLKTCFLLQMNGDNLLVTERSKNLPQSNTLEEEECTCLQTITYPNIHTQTGGRKRFTIEVNACQDT